MTKEGQKTLKPRSSTWQSGDSTTMMDNAIQGLVSCYMEMALLQAIGGSQSADMSLMGGMTQAGPLSPPLQPVKSLLTIGHPLARFSYAGHTLIIDEILLR